jgi:hypothetical protein
MPKFSSITALGSHTTTQSHLHPSTYYHNHSAERIAEDATNATDHNPTYECLTAEEVIDAYISRMKSYLDSFDEFMAQFLG